MLRIAALLIPLLVWPVGPALTQQPEAVKDITVERMNDLIEAVGDAISKPRDGQWQFRIEGTPVFVVSDTRANRMRILVGITQVDKIPETLFKRLMQANFDTTLDARYAVARGVVWAAFLHPFKSLGDAEFLSGLGQTVNLARTFGTSYSSGGLTYGGGDSAGILERQLIEKLLEKGLAI
tara:strand:+ start:69 stop:608 length:540 start_codon:yes stop_codon:yes gene_type:complete